MRPHTLAAPVSTCQGHCLTGSLAQDVVPFMLEERLKELGGLFERAEADWAPHAVR